MTTKPAGPSLKRYPRWAKYTLLAVQVVTGLMVAHVLQAMPAWSVIA